MAISDEVITSTPSWTSCRWSFSLVRPWCMVDLASSRERGYWKKKVVYRWFIAIFLIVYHRFPDIYIIYIHIYICTIKKCINDVYICIICIYIYICVFNWNGHTGYLVGLRLSPAISPSIPLRWLRFKI
jgi:hypothetical protein